MRRLVRCCLLASLIAVFFGVATVVSGGSVLFGSDEQRAAAGAWIPFVVTFNFAAGFAYVTAGIGLWLRRRWAAWLASIIAATTALVFVAFGVHVLAGGDYELRTVVAMTVRTLLWLGLAVLAFRATRHAVLDASARPSAP